MSRGLNKDLEGRAFQTEGTASAKVLRWIQAWCPRKEASVPGV